MSSEGVALWDAEGDDDARFQKELDDEVADEPARASSGGRDSDKKPRALAREERRLDGADYLSRHGVSHAGGAAARAASPEPSGPPKAVYISGLTWWTTDVELETLASQFGPVEKIKFFEDKLNGKSKGYALVEFVSPEAAAACKDEIQGRLLHGKQPVVAFPPPAGAGDAGGAAGARGAADAQQRWPQQPPAWQPPNAGRGGPQWGGPPPGWRGPPGPYPPWGGPGRGGPFPGAMGMMPGYGPMPGMTAPGYRGPYYPGDGRQDKGREESDGDRGKDRKKRHRDDEPKEKSRRKDRRSRSRSRSR